MRIMTLASKRIHTVTRCTKKMRVRRRKRVASYHIHKKKLILCKKNCPKKTKIVFLGEYLILPGFCLSPSTGWCDRTRV
jgi:hypothetical protein